MLALTLTLATVGMTTLTQHALADASQPGDPCYHHFAYPCDSVQQGNNGYQQVYAQDCTRPDSNCNYDGFNQQPNIQQVQYVQFAENGFSCYGEWRCASGWNHAIVDAWSDYHSGVTIAQNQCPDGHTDAYCSGYVQGYTQQWNDLVNSQPGQQQQLQQQQCVINNSPGAVCTQNEQANQG